MKRYAGVIIALGALLFGAFTFYGRMNKKVADAEQSAEFARLQQRYLERVSWIRVNPDEKAYREEVNPFLRNYFKDVDAYVSKFGLNKDYDDYLIRAEKKAAGKGDKKGPDPKAHYDYVKAKWDLLKGGEYDPQFTATDQGMRLDVTTEEKMIGGEPHIRYHVLVWGAQRELKDDGKVKRMATSASFAVHWSFFDDRGKLLAEMNATDPSSKKDWPEQFITEFPPQMVFGHYDVGLVPAEVKRADITFTVTSRAQTGGEAQGKFTWKLDVPPEWKLAAGQKWVGAEETTRPVEEIEGK